MRADAWCLFRVTDVASKTQQTLGHARVVGIVTDVTRLRLAAALRTDVVLRADVTGRVVVRVRKESAADAVVARVTFTCTGEAQKRAQRHMV